MLHRSAIILIRPHLTCNLGQLGPVLALVDDQTYAEAPLQAMPELGPELSLLSTCGRESVPAQATFDPGCTAPEARDLT